MLLGKTETLLMRNLQELEKDRESVTAIRYDAGSVLDKYPIIIFQEDGVTFTKNINLYKKYTWKHRI